MGLIALVEAAGILSKAGYRFRVIIGGSGSLAQQLQSRIAELQLRDQVYLVGRIADEQLPLCYGAADCFVLPTRALECFGLIVLEAYACGVPVIATPVGAIPELVRPQGADWLCDGVEASQIAERMEAFLCGEMMIDRDRLRHVAQSFSTCTGLAALAEILRA
jgi:glycosyltransferase involved in cell wall biosynthesis